MVIKKIPFLQSSRKRCRMAAPKRPFEPGRLGYFPSAGLRHASPNRFGPATNYSEYFAKMSVLRSLRKQSMRCNLIRKL